MTCSRYGFHSDRTFEILRSGYWYIPFAFPAYVFTGYPYLDEKPALSYFQRTIFNGALTYATPPLCFKDVQRNLLVVGTGIEPVLQE